MTIKWFDRWLKCVDCDRTTVRPPQSDRPCAWCGGVLTALEESSAQLHQRTDARSA